jgi:hypothetical protein
MQSDARYFIVRSSTFKGSNVVQMGGALGYRVLTRANGVVEWFVAMHESGIGTFLP